MLARGVVIVLCAVGLVAMHQLPSPAFEESGHHAVASPHDCHDEAAPGITGDHCDVVHGACMATVPEDASLPTPGGDALTVAAVGRACPHPVSIDRTSDPPDLNVLSISRT